jgi:hypothetical protein
MTEERPIRKFDGMPVEIEATTLLLYYNGDPGADNEMPTAILAFTDVKLAEAFQRLSRQKAELTPAQVGTERIKELVRANPQIEAVALVVDLGPQSLDRNGKIQRPVYRCYIKRQAFLSD